MTTLGNSATPQTFISDLTYVGGGFAVRFHITVDTSITKPGVLNVYCDWQPDLPTPKEFAKKIKLDRYYAARDRFFFKLLAKLTITPATRNREVA